MSRKCSSRILGMCTLGTRGAREESSSGPGMEGKFGTRMQGGGSVRVPAGDSHIQGTEDNTVRFKH